MFQKLSLGAPESSWLDVRPQFHATQSVLHEYHLADLGDYYDDMLVGAVTR